MQERQRVGKLWAYIGRFLDAVPAWCVPILCLDAKGRVGSHASAAVGHADCQRENWNGQQLREFCERHHLCLVNKFFNVGPTYRGEFYTLLYHHHCSLLSSHVLFFMVPGNGCKRLLPLAGETIGPYIVLLPTSCATNSLQGQIFTVGIPTCWSVVFWTAMAGKRFFTMFRQPSRHSLWNNWLMARLAHTGDTSLPWCEMKLQKCLGKKLVSRPTGLWTRSKHLMTGLLQWNNLCRFHLLYAVAMRFFTSPRSTSGFKSLVTCCAILEGSQATRRAAQA